MSKNVLQQCPKRVCKKHVRLIYRQKILHVTILHSLRKKSPLLALPLLMEHQQ